MAPTVPNHFLPYGVQRTAVVQFFFVYYACFLVFFHSIHRLRPYFLSLFSPVQCNSDSRSHSRLFPPLPHYGSYLAFFIARALQPFLKLSTRVDLHLSTLGALGRSLFFILQIHSRNSPRWCSNPGSTLVTFDGNH